MLSRPGRAAMGQIPSPRTVAVTHDARARACTVMGHMGHAAGLPMLPIDVMGNMGRAPAGLGARGEGAGHEARGKWRAGSYGRNIQPEKIAAIHTHVTL